MDMHRNKKNTNNIIVERHKKCEKNVYDLVSNLFMGDLCTKSKLDTHSSNTCLNDKSKKLICLFYNFFLFSYTIAIYYIIELSALAASV